MSGGTSPESPFPNERVSSIEGLDLSLPRHHRTTTQLAVTLLSKVEAIIGLVERAEIEYGRELRAVHPSFQASARNLIHFDALAKLDLTELKHELRTIGLNGDITAPFAVLPTLRSVRDVLQIISGQEIDPSRLGIEREDIGRLENLAVKHAELGLGPAPQLHPTRVMVSSHGELARDFTKVKALVEAGMNILRINCAHGNADEWRQTAQLARRAANECGKHLRIICDLAGPKVRTGPLEHDEPIILRVDDTIHVKAAAILGRNKACLPDGTPHSPAQVSCTLPEALKVVSVGDRVLFDDGNISGVVEACDGTSAAVRITYVLNDHHPLLAKKGINFPDTVLKVPALSATDRAALATVVEIADMVALSFTRSAEDIADLETELTRLHGQHLTVVLKPETPQAIADLPRLILAAMQSPPIAIMIPRGDLAVELGYDKLSPAQERILTYGEAAHIGVIWATQVLEKLTTLGVPARAEVTDVIAGSRADCIMLPYGPHVVKTVKFIDKILPHTNR
jgi:pyruvate kinase